MNPRLIVRQAKRALAMSEKGSWQAADAFVKLADLNWTQQRIAEACETSQSRVCKFLACARKYSVLNNRPSFWDVFCKINGEKNHISQNSGVSEWYTPPPFVEAARTVLGEIDLDPASSNSAQRIVKAKVFFDANDDGLSKRWSGRVWLNPPYSGDLVGRFVAKLCSHFQAGDVSAAILLTNNATETQWCQDASRYVDIFCLLAGRIRYYDADGQPANSPLQGQIVMYLGPNPLKFVDVFSSLGICAKVFHDQQRNRGSGCQTNQTMVAKSRQERQGDQIQTRTDTGGGFVRRVANGIATGN